MATAQGWELQQQQDISLIQNKRKKELKVLSKVQDRTLRLNSLINKMFTEQQCSLTIKLKVPEKMVYSHLKETK